MNSTLAVLIFGLCLFSLIPFIFLWLLKLTSQNFRIVKECNKYVVQKEMLHGWVNCIHTFDPCGCTCSNLQNIKCADTYEDARTDLLIMLENKDINYFYVQGWGFKNLQLMMKMG